MIDPAKLTAENGFVEGCVVEIVCKSFPLEYFKWQTCDFPTDDIISIRPLTGPMAIWNFSPDRATSVIVDDLGDIVWYEDLDPGIDMIGVVFHCDRPFWARSEK